MATAWEGKEQQVNNSTTSSFFFTALEYEYIVSMGKLLAFVKRLPNTKKYPTLVAKRLRPSLSIL